MQPNIKSETALPGGRSFESVLQKSCPMACYHFNDDYAVQPVQSAASVRK